MIPLSLEFIYGANTTVSAHSGATAEKMRELTYALRQNCCSQNCCCLGHVWALQTILIYNEVANVIMCKNNVVSALVLTHAQTANAVYVIRRHGYDAFGLSIALRMLGCNPGFVAPAHLIYQSAFEVVALAGVNTIGISKAPYSVTDYCVGQCAGSLIGQGNR